MRMAVTLLEDSGKTGAGLLGERVRELDDAVSRNRTMFYKRAFRYLGNAPDAEDAVQDALLSAFTHLAQFRGQAQMSSWVTAIVTNAARMQLRRRRAVPGIHLSVEQQYEEEIPPLSERLPDAKPSPEQVCCTTDARDRLLKLASQLPPTLRRVFQLRDVDGLTTNEVALALGVPEGTVEAQLGRSRTKLARIIQVKSGRQRSRLSGELAL